MTAPVDRSTPAGGRGSAEGGALAGQIAAMLAAGRSPAVTARLVDLLVDITGVTVAGREEPAAKTYRSYVREAGDRSASAKAGSYAVAGHALDFDDTHGPSLCHVSVAVVPALAALDAHTRATGGELLDAYALGIGTVDFLAPYGPVLNDRGIHSTGILGAVAAAASCGWLLTRDPDRAAMAVELSCSMAAGICAAFGTMAKPLQAANAAQVGLRAALLAAQGFEAAPGALLGPTGLMATLCGTDAPDGPRWGRTSDEAVEAIGLKPYPCCLLTHAAIDAALEVRARSGSIEVDDIEQLDVRAHPIVAALADRRELSSAADSKFSLRYALLVALTTGVPVVEDFDPGTAATRAGGEPAWSRWLQRIVLHQDPSVDRLSTALDARMADGTTVSTSVRRPLGAAENPMDRDAIEEKFRRNTAAALGEAESDRMLRALRALPDAPDGFGPVSVFT